METEAGTVEVEGRDDLELRPCGAGPVLVRGASEVTTADGTVHEVRRPVVAVCACGKTSRGAWCDGTHKVIPRTRGIREV